MPSMKCVEKLLMMEKMVVTFIEIFQISRVIGILFILVLSTFSILISLAEIVLYFC